MIFGVWTFLISIAVVGLRRILHLWLQWRLGSAIVVIGVGSTLVGHRMKPFESGLSAQFTEPVALNHGCSHDSDLRLLVLFNPSRVVSWIYRSCRRCVMHRRASSDDSQGSERTAKGVHQVKSAIMCARNCWLMIVERGGYLGTLEVEREVVRGSTPKVLAGRG